MRMPPDLDGHGGSQRAWHLLEALRRHGDVHFVMVYRGQDLDCVSTSLAPLEGRAASVTRIDIPSWNTAEHARYGIIHPRLRDLMRLRSIEAPRFSGRVLARIAASLPVRDADLVFAGRLCCAVLVQDLIDRGLLRCRQRLVDFDDIMSTFRWRQMAILEPRLRGRIFPEIDARLIRRSERRIACSWDAVSVCTDEDAAGLHAEEPATRVFKVPNIVTPRDSPPRPAPRPADGRFRVLFVGNLSFAPNVTGLGRFLEHAWPSLLQAIPGAVLSVVGFSPSPEVHALARRFGFALHADAPRLGPHYRDCDVTIAPILFGSGTRIKILESMAFGRPVVSTPMGAEGLGLEHGRHLLLAETIPAFAEALTRLARDPALRSAIAAEAHAYQAARFGPEALAQAVGAMVRAGPRWRAAAEGAADHAGALGSRVRTAA